MWGQRQVRNRQRQVRAFHWVSSRQLVWVRVWQPFISHCQKDTDRRQPTQQWMGRLKLAQSGSSSTHPPAMAYYYSFWLWAIPQHSLAPFVMCFVCVNTILSVPHGQLNGNIFKMRNIWGFLIGQFLLPTYVAFFHSKKKKKRTISTDTHIATQSVPQIVIVLL